MNLLRLLASVFLLTLVVGTAAAQESDSPADVEPGVSFDADPAEPSSVREATAEDSVADEPQPRPAPEPGQAEPVESAATSFETMDHLNLDATSVTGNRELPKVLYIVPWKKSDLGDLRGRPVNSLLDEVLSPVDREEFQRHLQYYGDVQPE